MIWSKRQNTLDVRRRYNSGKRWRKEMHDSEGWLLCVVSPGTKWPGDGFTKLVLGACCLWKPSHLKLLRVVCSKHTILTLCWSIAVPMTSDILLPHFLLCPCTRCCYATVTQDLCIWCCSLLWMATHVANIDKSQSNLPRYQPTPIKALSLNIRLFVMLLNKLNKFDTELPFDPHSSLRIIIMMSSINVEYMYKRVFSFLAPFFLLFHLCYLGFFVCSQ